MLLKKITIAAALVAAAISSNPVSAADYEMEPSHTALVFAVTHFGYSNTYGRFNKIAGKFSFDKANPKAASFEATIDATSIDTNNEKRDEHLQGPDFFDAKQFPTITFKSTGVEGEGADLKLMGNMTMHGVTNKVEIPLKYMGEGKGPYGKYRCGFGTEFKVKRSDYGMKGMVPAIGDEITLMFSFEGIKK